MSGEIVVESLEPSMPFRVVAGRGQFRIWSKDGRQPRWLVRARKERRKRKMRLRKKRGWR